MIGTDQARLTKIKYKNVTMQENKQVFCSTRKMIHFSWIFKYTNGKGHPESSNECFKSAGNSEHPDKDGGPFGGKDFSPSQQVIWHNSTNRILRSRDATLHLPPPCTKAPVHPPGSVAGTLEASIKVVWEQSNGPKSKWELSPIFTLKLFDIAASGQWVASCERNTQAASKDRY